MTGPDLPGATLSVEFIDECHRLDPGEELTFGRSGDIVVDDNRYLHRLLGRFEHRSGLWWVANSGSTIVIRLSDLAGTSSATVAPGASVPLGWASTVIAFEAGGSNYELTASLEGHEPPASRADDEVDGELTATSSSLPLTDEQRLLLVVLAESWLRHGGPTEQLPTNRQIANRLGWTLTKFNRKLDGLCRKYDRAGVSGLRGSSDSLARDRRLRLTEHAVHSGVVSRADLSLLDPFPPSTG